MVSSKLQGLSGNGRIGIWIGHCFLKLYMHLVFISPLLSRPCHAKYYYYTLFHVVFYNNIRRHDIVCWGLRFCLTALLSSVPKRASTPRWNEPLSPFAMINDSLGKFSINIGVCLSLNCGQSNIVLLNKFI